MSQTYATGRGLVNRAAGSAGRPSGDTIAFMKRISALAALVAAGALCAPAQAHVPPGPGADDLAQARAALAVPRPLALPAQQPAEPPIKPTPRAQCRPGSKPEPGMQGRLPREEVDSGRAAQGYRCNLELLGHSGNTGGFRVHRYIDRQGRECAYYDTALLFPTNALSLSGELTGVAVLDMSDPRNPKRTDTLLTPAMQSPHESVNISVQRGILAAVLGNPSQYPGGVDVYDISKDCRHPEPMAAAFPASPFGHESGMAPDGMTFYPTSIGTNDTTAVDLSDPRLPRQVWNGRFNTHGMSVSDDGNRGYFATGDGLVIADLSEVQARKPNPQVREISRLTWSNITIPQIAIPVTIKGRSYVVEVDEYSQAEGGGSVAGHGPRVGAARIIDISDETKPRVVSNIRLEVHQPENREAIAGDYGTQSPVQGYAGHYCNVPRRVEPGIFACSMILSGLRVFDIRDPERPKEIAYYMAPPSTISASGSPIIDERANWAMSQPAFAPERGEIWYSDGTSGFYALKMDPAVWPFPNETGPAGCIDNRGLKSVGARGVRGGVRLRLARRRALPVRVDVFRVSAGRRVLRERRVASFTDRSRSFTWRTRLAPGLYFARFRMFDGRRVYDTQRVVFERTRSGAFRRRPGHHRRNACALLRAFKLERPAFGGRDRTPLRLSYRLTAGADVSVTVTRGRRTIKRFVSRRRAAGRTYRLALPARGLSRGDYRVRLRAVSGEDQISATLVARRI
jgi:hypothetical protein